MAKGKDGKEKSGKKSAAKSLKEKRERTIKRTIKTTKATKATERLRIKIQIIETIKNRISQDKNNSTIRATAITITIKEIATITETMLLKKGIITKITATAIASLITSLRA